MSVAFKDFAPAKLRSGVFRNEYEPLGSVVARANAWMQSAQVRVVNIETIVLPNLQADPDTLQSGIRTSGDVGSFWFQIIRVWYEVDEPPRAPAT